MLISTLVSIDWEWAWRIEENEKKYGGGVHRGDRVEKELDSWMNEEEDEKERQFLKAWPAVDHTACWQFQHMVLEYLTVKASTNAFDVTWHYGELFVWLITIFGRIWLLPAEADSSSLSWHINQDGKQKRIIYCLSQRGFWFVISVGYNQSLF